MNYDEISSTVAVVVSTIIVLSVSWFAGLFKWMTSGLLQTVTATIVIFLMILVLTVVIGLMLHNLLRKKYKEENDKILCQFNATKDAAAFYESLVNMKNHPRFLEDKNMRYVSLSTALCYQGRTEEALQALDEVHTKNKEISALVEEQRLEIMLKAEKSQ